MSAERTAAFVAFAKRARSRAEQSARIAQEYSDRVEAAYRYAERAAARITGPRKTSVLLRFRDGGRGTRLRSSHCRCTGRAGTLRMMPEAVPSVPAKP